MPTPAPEMVHLVAVFAIAFTTPTYKKALVLLYGAILTPGRRTVTAALRVMGLAQEGRFGKFHRVLSRARWEPRSSTAVCFETLFVQANSTWWSVQGFAG